MEQLALCFYRFVTWCMQPWVRLRLQRRARQEPLYGQLIEERFGRYTAERSGAKSFVWIHAVSLGETLAAAILLRELREQMPQMRLLLTHGTATGRAEGAKLLREGDVQVWQPWDSRGAVQRFFAHFQPHIGILMETEVWPELCAGAQAAGVPLVLANARLNEKSMRRAQQLAWLARPAYASLTQVLAQTEQDANRLEQVGVNQGALQVLGNVKFDVQIDSAQLALGQSTRQRLNRSIIMLAVSREGEEALFLEAITQKPPVEYAGTASELIANKNHPKPQYFIVPRHPQRFEEVAVLCERAGLSISKRSTWGVDLSALDAQADVLIGDSMGEMVLYYGLADAALLGGSFAPLGGQNLIQAIACNCPVLMGPHTFNFAQACEEAQATGAAQRVPDMHTAVCAAMDLLQRPEALTQMRVKGKSWLAASQGAARRMAVCIVESTEVHNSAAPQHSADPCSHQQAFRSAMQAKQAARLQRSDQATAQKRKA